MHITYTIVCDDKKFAGSRILRFENIYVRVLVDMSLADAFQGGKERDHREFVFQNATPL